jgi:single-strand DNA-binding protein
MEITGRLTANAEVRNVKGDKKVTGFTIAMNRTYKKGDEKKTITTYVDCSYWINSGVAEYLKKGTLVQLYGDMDVNAWIDKDGNPKGRLTFHTQTIKILAKAGNGTAEATATAESKSKQKAGTTGNPDEDDLPF